MRERDEHRETADFLHTRNRARWEKNKDDGQTFLSVTACYPLEAGDSKPEAPQGRAKWHKTRIDFTNEVLITLLFHPLPARLTFLAELEPL
ncbi:hypothetical protein BaRGS_00016346 [Batillaria attramentaria]|uniref:Uncharacterized protein n=1 Tax=Batillaria attramentaria TaxID=370345 RepID=A0ABD0KZ02_9CAEN